MGKFNKHLLTAKTNKQRASHVNAAVVTVMVVTVEVNVVQRAATSLQVKTSKVCKRIHL